LVEWAVDSSAERFVALLPQSRMWVYGIGNDVSAQLVWFSVPLLASGSGRGELSHAEDDFSRT